ncbi:MAG TPA: hypothetical protein VHX59_17990, partial [Mycobacteriales bacterium]|nr:hypothetical protein [Mycobacteriales bacterium]
MRGGSLLGIATEPEVSARRRVSAGHIAVALLLLVPLLAFVVPAIAGHPIMPNDDADQNYPLRVLAGRQLAAGHLPLLNPYIWSGAPLLGGWNAGAAYPFTALFAILPPVGAWVANEVLTYWTAGLGLYAFLRSRGIRPVGAWLGATAFTVGGSFAIQVEHFGLVAGVSWIPLGLLALARLAEVTSRRRRVGWAALLGVFGAMCVLAGEPRAIDDAAVIIGAYALWLLIRGGRSRRDYLLAAVGGLALAVLLSAVQWLPGLYAVSESQRSEAAYDLFSSGSLHPAWLVLLTMPVLLGGSNSFRVPGLFAGYNMPELASYIGLLPLVGAVALLGTLRRRRPIPEWLIWHVVAAVGLLFALGGHTPLGHLLYHLPLFGSQRLQSRNVTITDLALAILFAYWAEHWLARSTRTAAHRLRLLGLVPVAVAAVFTVIGLGWPGTLARLLGVPRATLQVQQMQPLYFSFLGIAAITAAYLICGPLLRGRVRAGLLAGV